ncbi:hypothetical protein WAI89_20505, partial [Acinetobacter baumannii]
ALGFLHSDIRNEFSQTVIRTLDRIDASEFAQIFAALDEQARRWLEGEGIPAERQALDYQIDVRYHRQGYEFPVRVHPRQFASEEGLEK